MSPLVRRVAMVALLTACGWSVDGPTAQSQQPLPAPSNSSPAASPRAESVPAVRAWPRRARVRARRAPVAAAPLPDPDSELAKAFINNARPAAQQAAKTGQPVKPGQPPLGTLLLQPPSNARSTPAPYSTRININNCTLEQLQTLPGVGAAMGAHLMAGRPYFTLSDLARDGVPLDTIQKIAPLITMD